MEQWKRELKGSPLRDSFKSLHKKLSGKFYMLDADCVWVSKRPPGVVAYVDVKRPGEQITFAEVIAYNAWSQTCPVYIVTVHDVEQGRFTLHKYTSGNWKPDPPEVDLIYLAEVYSWSQFESWQKRIRDNYEQRR